VVGTALSRRTMFDDIYDPDSHMSRRRKRKKRSEEEEDYRVPERKRFSFTKSKATLPRAAIPKQNSNHDRLENRTTDAGGELGSIPTKNLPREIQLLLKRRQAAKDTQDWAASDTVRMLLNSKGYFVSDRHGCQEVTKIAKAETAKKDKKAKKKKRRKDPSATEEKFPMGIKVIELKLGAGKVIKTGKLIEVTYVGRFNDSKGKVFDRSTGNGFQFRLGRKEVIKGWDLGLRGMRVGGKRRLIVPPAAGYGANRYENIPGGSTLCFDVQVERAQE
jgi:FKBP-type peptidyl-prolyl cis-trans isomerase